MFNARRFTLGLIRPILQTVDLWSPSAEKLILGTALVESKLDHFYQLNGPALGVYQMEPETHNDIWNNWLNHRGNFSARVQRYSKTSHADEMVWNLAYATLMCRIHYIRVPIKLPSAGDLSGLANYWKDHYNTKSGKGKPEDFILFLKMYGDLRI